MNKKSHGGTATNVKSMIKKYKKAKMKILVSIYIILLCQDVEKIGAEISRKT